MADFYDFTKLFKLDAISSSESYGCNQNWSALFSSLSFSHFLTILSVLCLMLCDINCNDAGGITRLHIKLQYR